MISQTLPAPGSIEKYFREKILQIPRVLAVLISRLCTGGSAVLVLVPRSLLLYYTLLVEYCCTWSISRICTADTAKYLQYFVRLVHRVLVLWVLWYLQNTFNMRSILGVWRFFVHLSVHRRFDNFICILLQTSFTIHRWSHERYLKQVSLGGGTRVLGVLTLFRKVMLRALKVSTGSTLLILWAL